ncbi:hypothetical protein FGK63_14135 [Ruegeria sediminis]|uniref:Uncharacterized protein n=1 Tax=Ruegeria sediminis TaxID=2583820 RepID=A0ABY2WXP8_9RHOB|nr:hypothetical protein [Ruegeria sediminis]TMV07237.1 hypothetical protein FGK63_14135 [Ruegeria sediminis]
MMVGFLAVGMLLGSFAGGIALLMGHSLLMALALYSVVGVVAVPCVALATMYAFPLVKVKILGQT